MNKFILKMSKKFLNRRRENYYNRLNWSSFLSRLESVFQNLKSSENIKNIGDFYFSTNDGCFNNKIVPSRRINQAQIRIGINRLPYHTLDSSANHNRQYQLGIEKGATIVFSQFANGKISIFLYPQKSDLMQEKKEWHLLAWNKNPNFLTEKKIEKYIKIYLKHIYSTSIDTAFDFSNYIHRLNVSLRHLTLTRFQEFNLGNIIVGLFTVIGAIATITTLII